METTTIKHLTEAEAQQLANTISEYFPGAFIKVADFADNFRGFIEMPSDYIVSVWPLRSQGGTAGLGDLVEVRSLAGLERLGDALAASAAAYYRTRAGSLHHDMTHCDMTENGITEDDRAAWSQAHQSRKAEIAEAAADAKRREQESDFWYATREDRAAWIKTLQARQAEADKFFDQYGHDMYDAVEASAVSEGGK